MKALNRDNFASVFGKFLNQSQIPARSAAAAIGCSEATMNRLLGKALYSRSSKPSLPTDETLKQAGTMMVIGYERYAKLSKADRAKVSEAIGTVAGGGIGFAAISSAIASLGSVAGLSAAGITSGLAAMGGFLGGGMAMGVAVAAAIPLTVGAVGLGVGAGVQHMMKENALNATKFDSKWETFGN